MKKLWSILGAVLLCSLLCLPVFADAAPIPPFRTTMNGALVLILAAAVIAVAAVLLIRAIGKKK